MGRVGFILYLKMWMGELYQLCTSIIFTLSMGDRTRAKVVSSFMLFYLIDGRMFIRIWFVQGMRKSNCGYVLWDGSKHHNLRLAFSDFKKCISFIKSLCHVLKLKYKVQPKNYGAIWHDCCKKGMESHVAGFFTRRNMELKLSKFWKLLQILDPFQLFEILGKP